MPKTSKIQDRPIYRLVLPDSLQLGKKSLIGVHVKNARLTAFNIRIEDANINSLGQSHFLVFNEQLRQWRRWQIEGNCTSVRGFGYWIAGTVIGSNVILEFDDMDRLTGKTPLNRLSPGGEARRQESTETGIPFDHRADFFELHFPGVLFLYEVQGHGASFPVTENASAKGRAQNRRVEIVFSDEQGRLGSSR
jgi:hypothetical protein